MNIIDRLYDNVSTLYEQVTGQKYQENRLNAKLPPFPPGVKPEEFLETEIRQLRDCLTQQATTLQYPPSFCWSPPMEIYSTEKQYGISIDLPGVTRADVMLSVANGQLVLKGERAFQKPEGLKTHHQFEKYYGPFQQRIPLAADADAREIEARFKNGVLEITMPKSEKAESVERKVTIS
jgi:HSP20 family protein